MNILLLLLLAAKPNVVVIMADDMGFSDVGCYGSEIRTPNLDGLAAKGLRFTRFYNNARCCPTRASLLTGLYPHQAGIGHMVSDSGLPGYRGKLNEQCATLGEVMKSAGYRTYLSGKWHVGENKGHWPADRGFERSYSLISGATNYFRLEPGRTLVRDSEKIAPPKDWYITDAITENAVGFVKDHGKGEKPFLLYLPYTAPHWPLHAHPDDIARYKGRYLAGWDKVREERHARQVKMGLIDSKWKVTPRDAKVRAWDAVKEKEEKAHRMAVYAAQIECMDRGVGKVLAQLDAIGAADNTLVLFLADNGGCAEIIDRGNKGEPAGGADSYLSYGVGWANASNTPFREYKHWVHEGGIATPLIARWPAVIKKQGITAQPGHLIDVMATCVDLSATTYPAKATPLEGKSLRPIFEGKTRPGHEALYWEHEGNRAVQQGDWKLVARHKGPWELYDLAADRTETFDLASKEPGRVRAMAKLHEAWAKRANVRPWDEVQKAKKGKE